MDAKKVIEYALSQVGYKEPSGKKNWNKYAEDIDRNHPWWYGSCGKKQWLDWCSVFVDDCFIQTYGVENAHKLLNRPNDNLGAVVSFAYNYLKSINRVGKNPEPGATIYFQNSQGLSHTGIVVSCNATSVTTVEGNAGPNNDSVVKNTYSRSSGYIYGYGYPVYAAQPQPTPQPTPAGYKKGEIYTVTCKGPLRIRRSASTDYEIIDNLYKGDHVLCEDILKDKAGNTWLKISGYVAAKYNGEEWIE